MVDLCLLKYPRSSLIDFHISTDKLTWLILVSNQDSKPGPVIAKASYTVQDQLVMTLVIRISKVNHVLPPLLMVSTACIYNYIV